MGDSDNTRVCPAVTRRMLLTGTAVATAAWPVHYNAAAAGALSGHPAFDPALHVWREWNAAHLKTTALCRKQQRLETQLVDAIGFPEAEVCLPGEEAATVWWPMGEEPFGDGPTLVDPRAEAEAEFAAHRAHWAAEDRRIGYSDAKREEQAAADHEQELFEVLVATPATTLSGVAGKLDAVLREGETCEECEEFPWPQIRSALADLVCIGQERQPDARMPGSDRARLSRPRTALPRDRCL